MLTLVIDFDTHLAGLDNETPMECTLAVVADAATRDEAGKLILMGIFDQITADKFPYQHLQMFLAVRLSASPAEFGRNKDFEFAFVGPDGETLGGGKSKAQVPKPESGTRSNVEMLVRMVNVPFPKPGAYQISILVGGDQKAAIRIDAVQRTPKRRKRND